MTVTGTAVRARGLRKIYRPARYREVTALNGLDLDIGAGEIVVLLGPNGAGKTTAVQILTGYRHRDAGEVSVPGSACPAGPPPSPGPWNSPCCRPPGVPESGRPGIRRATPGRISNGQNVITCLSDG
jgi:energy-coupling factor transporter ATP-binding protein EcfA2